MKEDQDKLKPYHTETISGVTIAVILDIRRAKKNQNYPVKIRITNQRKRMYFHALDLSINEWESMPDTRKQNLVEKRELIVASFNNVKKHIEELTKSDGFSFDALNSRLKKGTTNSIIAAFHAKEYELVENNQLGSVEVYKCARKSIEKFLATDKKKDLKFADVTPTWLNKYEQFLRSEKRGDKIVIRSYSTIGMYLRSLRAIVNEGLRNRLITSSQYSFGKRLDGKYVIPSGTGRKLALTVDQIGEILQYQVKSEIEERCRDLWLFSYLSNGCNYSDMLRLRFANIVGDEILFFREKTKKTDPTKSEIHAVILPQIQEIINKWGNPDRKPDNYIFPILKPDMKPEAERLAIKNFVRITNKKMSEIGESLGFGSISTYVARHSYATVLKRSGANIAFISESLGHRSIKTTQTYLASFERETRIKYAFNLMNFNTGNVTTLTNSEDE